MTQHRKNALLRFGQFLFLAIFVNSVLVACMNSEDAPLSDDEKIKRAHAGHDQYMQGNQGTKPGTPPGTPSGTAPAPGK